MMAIAAKRSAASLRAARVAALVALEVTAHAAADLVDLQNTLAQPEDQDQARDHPDLARLLRLTKSHATKNQSLAIRSLSLATRSPSLVIRSPSLVIRRPSLATKRRDLARNQRSVTRREAALP